jgi:hypothetical protein
MGDLGRVRFVPKAVLEPFCGDGEWEHDPGVLRRAAEALGYVPWTFWHESRCDGPCGVFVVCPLCWATGMVRFADHAHGRPVTWTYNGDPDRPTLAPSILRRALRPGECALHIWVRDGQILDAGTPAHQRPVGR